MLKKTTDMIRFARLLEGVNISPLLRGGLEDYMHSLEHAEENNPVSNKYAVIHAGSAIELVLMEKVRSMGLSILDNKPPFRSIGFYKCIEILQQDGIIIRNLPDIELVHQERNMCVHQATKPDKERVTWLLMQTEIFLHDFCNKELRFPFQGYYFSVKDRHKEANRLMMNIASLYFTDAVLSELNGKYSEAIFYSFISLEYLLEDYFKARGMDIPDSFNDIIHVIQTENILPKEIISYIRKLNEMRNRITHGERSTKEDAEYTINITRSIFNILHSTWTKEKRCSICGSQKVVGEETESSINIDINKIWGKLLTDKLNDKQIVAYYCKKHEPYWIKT